MALVLSQHYTAILAANQLQVECADLPCYHQLGLFCTKRRNVEMIFEDLNSTVDEVR